MKAPEVSKPITSEKEGPALGTQKNLNDKNILKNATELIGPSHGHGLSMDDLYY